MNLLKIKEKIIKDTKPVWHNAIAKELGVETILIEGGSQFDSWNGGSIKKIVIDGHQITNIKIDNYGNMNCSIGKEMPVKYLPIFGRVLTELFPTENYTGRPNYNVHIRYFERFNKNLSLEDIKEMFRTGQGCNCTSFRVWLIGSFEPELSRWQKDHSEKRPSDCNIPDNYHLSYAVLSVWEPGYMKTWWEQQPKNKKQTA